MFLPTEIINHIYSFDSTHIDNYNDCLLELSNYIKKYNYTLVTFNCVTPSQQKYFRNFNTIFHKFYLN